MFLGTASGKKVSEVEHWMGKGPQKASNPNQTPNADTCFPGVSPWGISFTDKRRIDQTIS